MIAYKDRRGPNAKLAKEIATLEKQGATALRTLDPGGSALAQHAIGSLRVNLAEFRAVLETLHG